MQLGVLHANVSECQRYECPGDASSKCGGFNAVAVYNTGVLRMSILHLTGYCCLARLKTTPSYVELTEIVDRDVKILFLLQLNGRNSRQIRRLLRLIYQPKHFYFIHVDSRQKFMQQGNFITVIEHVGLEMKDIQLLLERQGYNNFHVSEQQFPTIWGGSGLLEMFLHVIEWTLSNPNFKHWDYIFNLSESDFPVLSLAELEAILAQYVLCVIFVEWHFRNKGKSFISAHGYNTGTFLKKQGYNFHFLQCENRMWRLSAR